MARNKKETVSISLRVPAGLKVSRSVLANAQRSAQAVVDSELQFTALSKELSAKGIVISAAELAKRSRGSGAVRAGGTAGGKRRRTVLGDSQRKAIISALRGGATVNSQATKFSCSPQTIMNIKKAAGLVKAKKAKKRAAKRK